MEFKKSNYINASKKFCNHFHYICLYYRHTHYGISQRQHVFRVYVIKMSWVEKNRKINNRRGDDYSGLESSMWFYAEVIFYF